MWYVCNSCKFRKCPSLNAEKHFTRQSTKWMKSETGMSQVATCCFQSSVLHTLLHFQHGIGEGTSVMRMGLAIYVWFVFINICMRVLGGKKCFLAFVDPVEMFSLVWLTQPFTQTSIKDWRMTLKAHAAYWHALTCRSSCREILPSLSWSYSWKATT